MNNDSLLKILSISKRMSINKLSKELSIIREIQISISMFLKLLKWSIIKVTIVVLHNTTGLDITIYPISTNSLLKKRKDTFAMKLFVIKSSLIGDIVFKFHQTLNFISFLKSSSKLKN